MPLTNIKPFALASLFAISLPALASNLPPTEAWNHAFGTSTHDEFAGPPAMDASGYCYFTYQSKQPSGAVAHLVKIGPSMNVVFDKLLPVISGWTDWAPKAVMISPLVSGKQNVLVIAQSTDSLGNVGVYLDAFDTNGNEWPTGRGEYLSFDPGPCYYVGGGFDSNGNFYLGVDDVNNTAHREFHIYKIGPTGAGLGDAGDSSLEPNTAFYSKTLGKWLVAGNDLVSGKPNSSRWAAVDPLTGNESVFQQSIGSQNQATGGYTSYQYVLNLFSNDTYAIVLNKATAASSTSGITFSWTEQSFKANGQYSWFYPAAGSASGVIHQIPFDSSISATYLVGRFGLFDAKSFVDLFDAAGHLVYSHSDQPVDMLFPTAGGFFSEWYYPASNLLYLEHYDNTALAYDWGKSYAGSGANANQFAGYTAFQNCFYFLTNLSNTTYDVLVDRFVTGICFNSITGGGSVHSGNTIPITLHLNAVATSNVTIGLNSNSSALLMPNGTKAQNFVITPGNSSIVVNMQAKTVASNTVVTVLGIQNGIYRFQAVMVQP